MSEPITLKELIDGALIENAAFDIPDPEDKVILATRMYYLGHHLQGCAKASLLARLEANNPGDKLDLALISSMGAAVMTLMTAVLKSPEWAMAILGYTPKDLVEGEFADLAEDWYANMPVERVMDDA